MNAYFMDRTPQSVRDLFHYVVWFDGGKFWQGDSLARLDKLYFADIDLMIEKLVRTVYVSQNLFYGKLEPKSSGYVSFMSWNITTISTYILPNLA